MKSVVIKIADLCETIVEAADDEMTEVAVMTVEAEVAMMTGVAEINDMTIAVVTDETVMVAVEIAADHQDVTIVGMIVMMVEVIVVVVHRVAVIGMRTVEGTMAGDIILMTDVALTRMIINKNVMMTVEIVVMTIMAVMMIVAVAMMVRDHTQDHITNTMIVVDTNKSEMTEDKNVNSRSLTGLDCH